MINITPIEDNEALLRRIKELENKIEALMKELESKNMAEEYASSWEYTMDYLYHL